VDILGISKPALLRSLWQNAPVAGFYASHPHLLPEYKEPPNDCRWSFDYYCGRPIKTDISNDTAGVSGYNRDSGPGKFEKCVADVERTHGRNSS
jgi:hypothetical protein